MDFNKPFHRKSQVVRLCWILVVFMSIIFKSSVAEHYTDACHSIHGRLGTCVPLASCPLFYGWLKVRPLVKENLRLLIKYTCYFDTSNPKVCCPNDNLYVSQKEEDVGIRLATPVRRGIDPKSHSSNKLLFPEPSPSLTPPSPTVNKDQHHRPQQGAVTSSSSGFEEFNNSRDRTPLSFPTERYNLLSPDRNKVKDASVTKKDLRYHPNFRLIPKLQECSNARKLDSLIGTYGGYPWIALIGVKRRRSLDFDHVCSGAIINSRYILTAAHCNFFFAKPRFVRLGEYNLDTLIDQGSPYLPQSIREDYKIEKFTIHDGYNAATGENDIAIIRLSREIALNTTFIKPVCLPFVKEYEIENRLDVSGVNDLMGKPAWVAGWSHHSWDGRYSTGSASRILQEGIVEFTSYERCRQDYPNLSPFSSHTQLCVGGKGQRNSCAGDSAAPLMYPIKVPSKVEGFVEPKFFMLGLLSHGPTGSVCGSDEDDDEDVEKIEAASRSLPTSVYTRVSKYLLWILNNIQD